MSKEALLIEHVYILPLSCLGFSQLLSYVRSMGRGTVRNASAYEADGLKHVSFGRVSLSF